MTFNGYIPSVPEQIEADETNVGDWSLVGTYGTLSYGSDPFSGSVLEPNGGEFVKAGADASVIPFSAFLKYSGIDDTVPDIIKVSFKEPEGPDTAVGTLNMKTGELIIDEWYDLNGRKLENAPSTKGFFINQGHKVIILR